jgi:hypothetical protein
MVEPERIRANGVGPIDVTLRPASNRAFKLIYVRVHFREFDPGGSPGTPSLYLHLDAMAGEEYNVQLFYIDARGIGADVNVVVLAAERGGASPWSFETGDGIQVVWAAADETVAWGIEIGVE